MSSASVARRLFLPAVIAAAVALDALGAAVGEPTATSGSSWLWWLLGAFLAICAIAFVLFIGVVVFLLWRAKKMIESAARPDLPKLHAELTRLRAAHPGLDDDQLARAIIRARAHRAGFFGFITGFGGLPLLPIMLPIDLATTVKIQSELVYLLRLLRAPAALDDRDFAAQAGLFALSAGGHQVATLSTAAVRRVVLKEVAESLVKFVPFLGGLLGYLLGYLSTQAMGRSALAWEVRKTSLPGQEQAGHRRPDDAGEDHR